jgi:hypothetical protein
VTVWFLSENEKQAWLCGIRQYQRSDTNCFEFESQFKHKKGYDLVHDSLVLEESITEVPFKPFIGVSLSRLNESTTPCVSFKSDRVFEDSLRVCRITLKVLG